MEGNLVHEAHSLGAFSGTNPLEMASAYAAFANGGYYIKPYTVTKIVYTDSNQTKEFRPSKVSVMKPSTAYLITNSLIWAVESGVSSGSRIYGRQVASKTGTTNFDTQTIEAYGLPYSAVKDYWVVGYTPKISVGLWYGYDNITEGYNTLADNNRKDKVFNTILKGIVDDSPKTFEVPVGVTAVQVEKGTIPAMLPSENTPKNMITTEYFKTGTEPTQVSPRYQQLKNPNNFIVEINKTNASLSWNEVSIPDYYTEEYMNKYITDSMGDTKENYIEYRKEELEELGTFGYDIYINDNYITTTTETSIDLDISSYDGDIKFVVKTAWSKNKTTISSGSEFTYSKSEASLVSVTPKGLPIVNIALNTHYVDESVLVLDNLKDVTSECNITTMITNSNNDLLSSVDTSTEDTYKIEYIVKYKNKTYRTTRTVIVS